MNYIYDVLLNFNDKLYDFYDWNKKDIIKHIKKIPIIKIDSKELNIIKNNQVEFDQNFLESIYNKTEEFHTKKRNIKYACLLTDDNEIIGININKKIYYSKLLLDEEIEILDIAHHMTCKNLNINIIKKNNIDEFKTRKQIEDNDRAKKELKKIIIENNHEKLKYIYYECFDNKIDSIEEIIQRINKEVNNIEVINIINNLTNINNV